MKAHRILNLQEVNVVPLGLYGVLVSENKMNL